jgi:hypothetical protein
VKIFGKTLNGEERREYRILKNLSLNEPALIKGYNKDDIWGLKEKRLISVSSDGSNAQLTSTGSTRKEIYFRNNITLMDWVFMFFSKKFHKS